MDANTYNGVRQVSIVWEHPLTMNSSCYAVLHSFDVLLAHVITNTQILIHTEKIQLDMVI